MTLEIKWLLGSVVIAVGATLSLDYFCYRDTLSEAFGKGGTGITLAVTTLGLALTLPGFLVACVAFIASNLGSGRMKHVRASGRVEGLWRCFFHTAGVLFLLFFLSLVVVLEGNGPITCYLYLAYLSVLLISVFELVLCCWLVTIVAQLAAKPAAKKKKAKSTEYNLALPPRSPSAPDDTDPQE